MKKIITTSLAVLMGLSLAACSSGQDAPADNGEAKKEFIVGFDAEFPPYGFLAADGSYDGFDLAMAAEVCDRLGWQFTALPIDWNSKDAELEAGNITCIWNGFTINGREDQYTWSDAYVDNSIVAVVASGSTVKTLADLEGKTVMVQSGSSGADALAESDLASSVEVISLPDYNQGFMELDQGSVEAVIVDLGVAIYQMNTNGADNYVVLDEAIAMEQYGVGFLKGDTDTCKAVNDTLHAMAADGTILKIAEKYVDEGLVVDAICLGK